MKHALLGVLILFRCLACVADDDGYHTFTNTEGKSIRAKIVEFDSSKKRLRIKRENGKVLWAPLNVFSEKDRNYILEWVAATRILSERNLALSVHMKKLVRLDSVLAYARAYKGKDATKRERSDEYLKIIFEKMCYEVTVNNKSSDPVYGLKIDYRCFIEIEDKKGNKWNGERVVSGTVELNIDARKSVTFTTPVIDLEERCLKSVVGYEDTGNGYSIQQTKSHPWSEDRLRGIWFKIYGPAVDGTPFVRDACFPDDLQEEVVWHNKTAKIKRRIRYLPVITPPEERGKQRERCLGDKRSYQQWLELALFEFRNSGQDRDLQRQVLEGLELFYDSEQRDANRIFVHTIAMECMNYDFFKFAIPWLERCIPFGIQEAHAPLARIYSSAPQEDLHDGAKAVEHAKAALEQDEDSDRLQDLLARAYARNGEYDLAVSTQKKAIEYLLRSLKGSADLVEYETRLELYQNGTPYAEAMLH